ncbi:MAG: MarR family transcriptional regulator [Clostridia bacterium]|nr:MarR family transcriptional regulator [Clostridia bacterium]
MRLQDCINFQLARAQNTVSLYFKSKLALYDFTPSQYALMNCLWGKDNQTPTQIAQTLCLDTSSISGLLARAEAKGFIQRQFNKEDRRTVIVSLTAKGSSMQEPINSLINDANRAVLEGICEAEMDGMIKCFSMMIENAQKNME